MNKKEMFEPLVVKNTPELRYKLSKIIEKRLNECASVEEWSQLIADKVIRYLTQRIK